MEVFVKRTGMDYILIIFCKSSESGFGDLKIVPHCYKRVRYLIKSAAYYVSTNVTFCVYCLLYLSMEIFQNTQLKQRSGSSFCFLGGT